MNDSYTINKRNNKLLFPLDRAVDQFVVLVIAVIRFFAPAKFQKRIQELTSHQDLLHNVIGLSFFNALGGLCVMATQVKLANYFGASVYGIYSYCLAIGEVGAMFVRYGRNKTMVRDLIQTPQKRDSLIVSTFLLSVINLVLFLSFVFACHKPLDIEVSLTYFLIILSPCLVSLSLEPVYESIKLMSWNSIYNLLQKFAFLTIIWGLFLSRFQVSLLTIGATAVATWLIVIILEYYEVSTQLHINFAKKAQLSNLWELYKSNFLIFLSCATGVAFGPMLRLILNTYADSRSVGIYAAGLQIYNIGLFLNTQMARVGNPMMAEAGRADCPIDRRRKLVFHYALIMLASSFLFALPMLFFPSTMVDYFFTAEYADLARFLPILGIYLMTISIGEVFTQYMISLRLDKTYFTIYILSALATIIIAYWFIPIYGVLGAFIALCVPNGVGSLCYMFFSLNTLRK